MWRHELFSDPSQRERILVTMAFLSLFTAGFCGQLGYLMIFRSEHYSTMADDLHERERTIKAARGEIVDRNGTVIASNRTVCTRILVVHNQVEEPEAVIRMLSGELELPEAEVRKKVEKRSSREIIKTNVDKADGDRIRSHGFAGVKVMRIISGITPTTAWLPGSWALQGPITRGSSAWRSCTKNT